MEDPVTRLFLELMSEEENGSLQDVDADDPNWLVKQAYCNGQRKMLKKLEKLING